MHPNELQEFYLQPLYQQQVTIFNNQREKSICADSHLTINRVFQKIEFGSDGHAEKVIDIRNRKSTVDYSSEQYYADKASLPHVCIHAHFSDYLKTENYAGLTGLMFLDFDNLYPEQVQSVKQALAKHHFIIAAYSSLSNCGVHAWATVSNVNSLQDYANCYKQLAVYFKKEKNLSLCLGSFKSTQIIALSYDPDIIYNAEPVALSYIKSQDTLAEYESLFAKPTLKQGAIRSQSILALKVDCEPIAPYNFVGRKYFSENFIDIHNPEMIAHATFNYGNGAYFFKDKYYKTRVFGIKGKVPIGKRNQILFANMCTFAYLNGHYTFQQMFEWLYNRNLMYCSTPLPEKEIERIVTKVLELKASNLLEVSKESRFTVFDSTCKLAKAEKLAVVSKNKKLKNILLIEEAIDQLIDAGVKITKEKIEQITGLSLRTIKTRWKTYSEKIEEHNLKIKTHMENKTESIKQEQDNIWVSPDNGLMYVVHTIHKKEPNKPEMIFKFKIPLEDNLKSGT